MTDGPAARTTGPSRPAPRAAGRRGLAKLAACLIVVAFPLSAHATDDEVADRLRHGAEAALKGDALVATSATLHRAPKVRAFYGERRFQSAWSHSGIVDEQARAVYAVLARADEHGLPATHYHIGPLAALLQDTGQLDAVGRAELDLLLTDAWLTYGAHLLRGRIDPTTLSPDWRASPSERDLVQALHGALREGRAERVLADLAPRQQGYRRLVDLLGHYRELEAAGGYPYLGTPATLRRGDSGDAVLRLRQRLELSGDIRPGVAAEPDAFDAGLEIAVIRYQRRHGLDVDGVVGPRTLAELDRPVEQRIRQVMRNLERWRWLPQDLGDRHVLVDIAGFELRVIEQERAIMTMRVIVGRNYRQTPVFSDRIRYLVLSPYWHVPQSIAVNDILPQVRRNPNYLRSEGFTVLSGWGEDQRVIDPATVDWANLPAAGFRYRFRQDPGPRNALGQVKFMFPNEFNVYLHDTPARGLFARTARDFSSGCIRIERPLDLAEYLLRDQPEWSRQRIADGMNQTRERDVPLRTAVPVHMIYLTVWSEPDGTAWFRPDVYDRDTRLDAVLFN